MIPQTSSPTLRCKFHTQNDNPALPPKRSFAHEEDPSQLDLKRRHVRPDAPRRLPLDSLSASNLENTRGRRSHSAESRSHPSLLAPPFVPSLRASLPEQPASSGYGATQPSGVFSPPVCSWPPPSPSPSSGRSSHSNSVGEHASHRGLVLGSAVETLSRVTTSRTWRPPLSDTRSSERSVRLSNPRPPAQLWRSGPTPMRTADKPVHSPTPLALSPRHLELRRSGSDSDTPLRGSISLSLAFGSQPLSASEHTKAVPPIGAERSRVASTTSPNSHVQNSPLVQKRDSILPVVSPWCPSSVSPNLHAEWNHEIHFLDNALIENVQVVPENVNSTKEDLERLLRHAIGNKHAPKVVSPLSPLRTSASAVDLASDPNYRLRMPSQSNTPSPRYAKCPTRRARTVCDVYQSFDWGATCIHCQECKRDSVGKKLLAFRYRHQQTRPVQGGKLSPLRIATNVTASAVGEDDRMVVPNRIREAFAYEVDDEEKSLWEEVAVATGGGPVSFSRVGAPCAAAHRRSMDDGIDDATYDDNLDIPDYLLGAESATLFREVSVY